MDNIRLICCDLDGTLLGSDKNISKENIEWIRKVRTEEKIPFAFVTGRPNLSVRRYFRALKLIGYSSCLNGCELVNEYGRVLISHRMSPEVIAAIVRCQRKTGIDMLMISGNSWFTEKQSGYMYEKKLPIYLRKSILCTFEEILDVNKILFMSQDPDDIGALAEAVLSEVGDPSLVTLYPGADFLEIMPGGINKGTGLEELASRTGTKLSEIMVIGDDLNDVEMFQKAGYSVAMGNSRDEVKALAKYVTSDNDHDGVANAIRHVVFSGR